MDIDVEDMEMKGLKLIDFIVNIKCILLEQFAYDIGIYEKMTDSVSAYLNLNAGVFLIEDSAINRFVDIAEESAKAIDASCMGFWCRCLEWLFQKNPSKALLVSDVMLPPISSFMMPPFTKEPIWEYSWTHALQGMKVLVIHLFASLIQSQYAKRKKLFEDKNILPEFDLRTYKAVQSHAGNCRFSSREEALLKMEEDISKIDFDIALIGCGAYGMPLGAYIKNVLKRKAIHIGGTLQLLLGIKGNRWEKDGITQYLYNQY